VGEGVKKPPLAKKTSSLPYDESVSKTVVDNYYPRVISAPEAARNRAQAAYTIASAVAAALIAAGLLTSLYRRPTLVKVMGSLALVGWFLAAGAYVWAVAAPARLRLKESAQDARSFVHLVLQDAIDERTTIDRRQGFANVIASVAAVLTAAAFISALLSGSPERRLQPGLVITSETGARSVETICGQRLSRLEGRIDLDTLNDQLVAIDVRPGECGGRWITVRIPRADVAGVSLKPR
jgi:hypothetical protein